MLAANTYTQKSSLLRPAHRTQRAQIAPARAVNATTRATASSAEKSSAAAVVILPGLGNNQSDYDELKQILESDYGHRVSVLPVTRLDWLRNAAGLTDSNYWKGTLSPRPTVDWYLNKISAAIEEISRAEDAPPPSVTLLAHSAGGWLGRLFLRDFDYRAHNVTRFVSLGSPHLPPPDGVIDQTRGILTYMEANVPGAFQPDVEYVTIAGTYATGAELLGSQGTISDRIVGLGYKQVCGDAAVAGDGVVPLPSAHLEGAKQVTLEGVYHSPLGADDDELAVVGGYADSDDWSDDESGVVGWNGRGNARRRRWYGSPEHVGSWVGYL